MTRVWAFLLAMIAVGPAYAQTIQVRSGEHADFSRLVITYGDVPEWTFGRVAGGYELRPKDTSLTYDLSKVYQFIPVDRLASIEPKVGGALFLAVTCDCHADAFEIRDRLVLDIKDGPADARARFETALIESPVLPAPEPENPGASEREEETPALIARIESATGLLQYAPQRTDLVWADGLSAAITSSKPPAPHPTTVEADALAVAQTDLLSQIGRAAAEGLIVPDLAATDRLTDPHAASPPHGSAEPPVAENPPEAALTSLPTDMQTATNFRIETAFDRGELAGPENNPMTEDGDRCLPSAKVKIADWGTPPDQGSAISDYRARIVGEFDAADPASIAALAKHYIYLTFGAEARVLLEAFDAEIPDKPLLIALADIMDNERASPTSALNGQVACETAVALWAIVAGKSLSKADNISRTTVLSAFAELPLHLRRHIGPILAERFLQIEDVDTAASIRNTIARAPGEHGDRVKMMTAEIALELGDTRQGTAHLTEIVKSDGVLAPDAVIMLIEEQIRSGNSVDPKLIETAAALAFEARGSEVGTRLEQVRLRALAHAGQVMDAMIGLALAIENYGLSQESAKDLRQEILDQAAINAPDALFLRIALGGPHDVGAGQKAGETRHRMASRLIDLDLFQAARDILITVPGIPEPRDRRLFARSFLGERRADLAMGYLAGLTDNEAMDLRAQAHLLAREYGRAADVYAGLGASDDQARAAWRGQIWDTARDIGTDAERAAAAIAAREDVETADANLTPMTLAHGESLLEQSRQTRLILNALLDETAKP